MKIFFWEYWEVGFLILTRYMLDYKCMQLLGLLVTTSFSRSESPQRTGPTKGAKKYRNKTVLDNPLEPWTKPPLKPVCVPHFAPATPCSQISMAMEDRMKQNNNNKKKTRDHFKKIRDTTGTFHAKMGTIKDRNGIDITEAEDIKKRWQEYREEFY